MSRKKLYEHFIRTDWNGLATKIKNLKKKTYKEREMKKYNIFNYIRYKEDLLSLYT